VAISEAWIGVFGALGGVIITGAIGLLTARMNHTWEREKQHDDLLMKRSELRRDAYSRLLTASQAIVDEAQLWQPDPFVPGGELVNTWFRAHPKLLAEYQAASDHAALVASEPVSQGIRVWDEGIGAYVAYHCADDADRNNPPDIDRLKLQLLQVMRDEQDATFATRPQKRPAGRQ
jgi:hypothetical protein